jgi:hypothetical protein
MGSQGSVAELTSKQTQSLMKVISALAVSNRQFLGDKATQQPNTLEQTSISPQRTHAGKFLKPHGSFKTCRRGDMLISGLN